MIVGLLPDGRLQVFAFGSDGNAYTRWKLTTDPSSDWSDWANLGNPSAGPPSGDLGIGKLEDGRLQIFAVAGSGNLYTKWKLTTDPDSDWSDWQKLGNGGSPFT